MPWKFAWVAKTEHYHTVYSQVWSVCVWGGGGGGAGLRTVTIHTGIQHVGTKSTTCQVTETDRSRA